MGKVNWFLFNSGNSAEVGMILGRNMKVSFDLDGTLFIDEDEVEAENKPKFPFSYFYKERLRFGSVELMKKIIKEDIELWIYTSSYRTKNYIKNYFRIYGIKIKSKNIINAQRHLDEIQKINHNINVSKDPRIFNIDLHIDDDTSLKQYGDINGFKVFSLTGNNKNWNNEVWDEIMKTFASRTVEMTGSVNVGKTDLDFKEESKKLVAEGA